MMDFPCWLGTSPGNLSDRNKFLKPPLSRTGWCFSGEPGDFETPPVALNLGRRDYEVTASYLLIISRWLREGCGRRYRCSEIWSPVRIPHKGLRSRGSL